MKKVLVFLALFTGLNIYPEIVDSAVFQTPDGTQISLFGDEHNTPRPVDEDQVLSLLASIEERADNTDRPLHVMLEEPSAWVKKLQRYPTVISSLRMRLCLKKDKKIKAESAEVRCASAAARYILSIKKPNPEYKMNAKALFGSRKLNKWQSVKDVTFNDLYAEFQEAFSKLEPIRPVDDLRDMLAEFKQTYPSYGDDSIYSVAQSFDVDMKDEMLSRIEHISDKILDYYLLVRALAKSRKKDVVIVAGAYHIGALRGLLQHEACSLVDYQNETAFALADAQSGFKHAIPLKTHDFSRIKTIYLKFVRYYIQLKRWLLPKQNY